MKELTKKDYIKMGMQQYIEMQWNIMKDYANLTDASEYIVDTYLECIDNISFQEWCTNGNSDGKPMIVDEFTFKELFEKVFNTTPLPDNKIIHLINEIYYHGNLSWEYRDIGTEYFYSTQFKDEYLENVSNFNYIGCLMEAERLLTLINIHNKISKEDLISSIEVINFYLNDYFCISDYSNNNPMAFLEDLNKIIGNIL